VFTELNGRFVTASISEHFHLEGEIVVERDASDFALRSPQIRTIAVQGQKATPSDIRPWETESSRKALRDSRQGIPSNYSRLQGMEPPSGRSR